MANLHSQRPAREQARQIADPQVRYMGTIGGNVANGDPGNDMPALMMTLGASYRLEGKSGGKDIPGLEVISTHPLTQERIAMVRAQLQNAADSAALAGASLLFVAIGFRILKVALFDADFAGRSAQSFIDDVLQASRLAWHQESLSVADVDLGDVLRIAVAATSARHKIAPASIRVDAPASLVVQSDRTALEIVVRNLLDKAIKYSQEPVDVTAHARVDGGRVVIEVRDRGIGIAKQHLGRVFQRFYRVPTESVRSRHGTGLGLFVVSQLVKNLGGEVVAESEGPGHGTTVRVTFPYAAAALAPAVAT